MKKDRKSRERERNWFEKDKKKKRDEVRKRDEKEGREELRKIFKSSFQNKLFFDSHVFFYIRESLKASENFFLI